MFWRNKKYVRLDSGRLKFAVHRPGSEAPEYWEPDLITMRLAAEELELQFRLETRDGQIFGTAEFFEALAKRYVELGAPACDPSQARAVWIAVNRRFNAVEAELSRQIAKLK